MGLTVNEILNENIDEIYRVIMDRVSSGLRVACPGIIQSFDPNEQTATIQCAIREKISNGDGTVSWQNIPLLVDVPVVLPRAGGMAITFPITAGDECLVIFSDLMIDGWWANGGVQNWIEKRRHDFSDGFAIFGPWSQPRVLSNYSMTSTQIRTDDGSTYIDIKPGTINLVAANVQKNGVNI